MSRPVIAVALVVFFGVNFGWRTWRHRSVTGSMLVSSAGLLVLLPNALAVASFVVMLTAVELQVRFVDEPYLLRTHGARYTSHAERAGRFVPGLGKGLVTRGDAR